MNIFLHELKVYRKSTIIWTLSLLAVVMIFFSIFPSFSKDIEQIRVLMEGFPEAIRIGIGISLDDFDNILGYYSFPFSFLLLIGAIQAMNLGISIVAKEVHEKTADFLLTRPISRSQILSYKILAALTSLGISNLIYIVVASISASLVKNDNYSYLIFFMISISLFFVQVIFMSLGLIISVILAKIKSVLALSLGTVFAFYFISFLSSTANDNIIRYITPFNYFDPAYIIENTAYEPAFIIITIIFISASITASYRIYSKKDIHTV